MTLDEPLAVISDQTRIVNYNWRGQGESSVFPNGQAGDASLGNTATEIDWPALTQAQTYFTPGPGSSGSGNPKRWMGTFVANGQGTTQMLYRRNRYFDPTSGQFTQADPIGIAGGINAFGFAKGDPVNFSDPLGLMACPPDCGSDIDPANLLREADRIGSMTDRDRFAIGAMTIGAALGGLAILAGTASSAVVAGLARLSPLAAGASRIPNGELETTFETAAGKIRVFGEAVNKGSTLIIDNFMVYPDNASRLQAGVTAMRSGFRGIEQLAREAGYSKLIVNYYRTAGANPGRTVRQIIELIGR